MQKKSEATMKGMGVLFSLAIYIPAAILLFFMTHYLIPFLHRKTGVEIIVFWFLVAAFGVFLPLAICAAVVLKKEGHSLNRTTWRERLRFRKLTLRELKWTIGGMLVIIVLSGAVLKGLEAVIGKFDHSPPFMSFKPLSGSRLWLLAIWLPYWIANILGEEFLWRGVMLPRQELVFGRYTWLFHGAGWGLFHIAFGWQLLITLLPIVFIQSYIVQKTKNSWSGVIIHGAINGPSFIAIALGWM